MIHEVHIIRGGVLMTVVTNIGNLEKAMQNVDRKITDVHKGLLGIGTFEFLVYEMAPEGHIESCVFKSEPIHIPKVKTETAA